MLFETFVIAGLTLCFKEHSPAIVKKPESGNVLLVGDSFGVGLSLEFKRLAREAGYNPIVHAKEGSLTREWVTPIKSILKREKPVIVFVSLGTNDAATSTRWLEDHRTDYQTIVEEVFEQGSKLIWIEPPTLHNQRLKNIDVVREKIRAATYDEDVFDSTQIDIERAPDGIHSTTKGYSSWMKKIWESTFGL